ncbi:MAG TPA: putative metallopeptidase [Nitrososphaerales archaeon]|nr:putative metallopeptidase [Nitrososphaerales archaeon]
MISYERAPDVEERAKKIIEVLHLEHIDQSRIHFFRSKGSKARRVQARIHGLGRIWFGALNISPNYVIEVISEEFDKLGDIEREKVIIHELMHIPSGFSGGFVPHRGKINRKTVDALHKRYSNTLAQ